MPGVLLRALSEYNFVGTPLLRMPDEEGLVRVELTFHKALLTKLYYKRRAESRKQPASADEWLRQPAPAARPTTSLTPARRQPTSEETPPPAEQTLQTTVPTTIRYQRQPQTAKITPTPTIMKPTTPPPSPASPPSKKPRPQHCTQGVLSCRH